MVKSTLRYNGLFDFDGLYATTIDWAKNYGYLWNETIYKHKVPSPRGAKQELTWIMTKNVTEYISYFIIIKIRMWDLTEVVVDIGGRKKALSSARVEMMMDYNVTPDWQKKFKSNNKWVKKMGDFYKDVIFGKRLDSIYGDQLHYRVLNLHSLLKQYFDMQSKKYTYKGYLGEG